MENPPQFPRRPVWCGREAGKLLRPRFKPTAHREDRPASGPNGPQSLTDQEPSPKGYSPRWRFSLGALLSQPHAIHPSQSFVSPSAGQTAQELGDPKRTRTRPSHSTDWAQNREASGKSEALVILRQKVTLTFRVQKQGPLEPLEEAPNPRSCLQGWRNG